MEGDTDDAGYDHNGESASLWCFLRVGLERGGPANPTRARMSISTASAWKSPARWRRSEPGRNTPHPPAPSPTAGERGRKTSGSPSPLRGRAGSRPTRISPRSGHRSRPCRLDRRLAGAVLAEQRIDLPGPHLEMDVAQRSTPGKDFVIPSATSTVSPALTAVRPGVACWAKVIGMVRPEVEKAPPGAAATSSADPACPWRLFCVRFRERGAFSSLSVPTGAVRRRPSFKRPFGPDLGAFAPVSSNPSTETSVEFRTNHVYTIIYCGSQSKAKSTQIANC